MSNTVLYMALFVFALLLILLVMLRFGVFASYFAAEGVCQSSLQLTKIAGDVSPSCMMSAAQAVKLNCPRNFMTVKDGEVLKGDDAVTGYYDRTCPNGIAAASCLEHNVVAEEMNSCWNLFFKGEQVVLQQVDTNAVLILKGKDTKTACFVCSQVKLDEGAPQFMDYLQKKQVREGVTYYDALAKNKAAFCDPHYSDYFPNCWEGIASGYEIPRAAEIAKSAVSIAIPVLGIHLPAVFTKERPDVRPTSLTKGEEYAVVFVRRGLGSCEDAEKDRITHQYLTNTVQLIPVEQVTQFCDVVIA